MKITVMIVFLIGLAVIGAGLALIVLWFMMRANDGTVKCNECAYLKGGKCKHWEEKRSPDMGICEAFKQHR